MSILIAVGTGILVCFAVLDGKETTWGRGCLFRVLHRMLLTGLLLAGVLSGPLGAAEPFRIGVVAALTGPKAVYGLSHQRGATLAVAEINRDGGIAGRPVELVFRDDHGEPGEVGALAVGLIHQERVVALLGSVDSGCTHVLSMVSVKAHVPHITCVATDPSLTRAGTPWTFRTLADDERQAGRLVEWLVAQNLRRIGVIAAGSRYGRMGAKTVARLARGAGCEVQGPLFLDAAATDVASAVTTVLAGKPAAVVVWSLAPEGLTIVGQLAVQGFRGPVAGGDGLASPRFFAASDHGVEGTIVTCPYDIADDRPRNDTFVRQYRSAFGQDPDSFAAHAYDTVLLIADGLRRSDGTREGLRAALAAHPGFSGATGEIRFDATGNDIRPVLLARCQAGRLVIQR